MTKKIVKPIIEKPIEIVKPIEVTEVKVIEVKSLNKTLTLNTSQVKAIKKAFEISLAGCPDEAFKEEIKEINKKL